MFSSCPFLDILHCLPAQDCTNNGALLQLLNLALMMAVNSELKIKLIEDGVVRVTLSLLRCAIICGEKTTATHCNTHYNTLQHTATHSTTHCNTLQQLRYAIICGGKTTATHCNTHYNTLQNTATHSTTHCNTLQQLRYAII